MTHNMAGKLTKSEWEARRKLALASDLPPSGALTIELDGSTFTLPLVLRQFGTGSRGYHVADRITTEHGQFQLNVTVTQVGSGPYKEG